MRKREFLLASGCAVMVMGGQVFRARAAEFEEYPAGTPWEPWRNWKGEANDGPLVLVRAAILSANAFNTQPWVFKVSPTRIDLYADYSRHLGGFDPLRRELYFSCGCSLENLLLAAPANGYRAKLTLHPGRFDTPSPETGMGLVASIDLTRGAVAKTDLYDAIPHRHTERNLFTDRAIPEAFLQRLNKETSVNPQVKVFTYASDADKATFIDIVETAAKSLAQAPGVQAGTARWSRHNAAELAASPDGVGGVPRDPNAPPPSTPAKLLRTGKLLGVVAVRDRYDAPQTLEAGRTWQRIHLLATAEGLSGQPANSAVEAMDPEKLVGQTTTKDRMAQFLGDAAWQPTFMFRLGYATAHVAASARRAVQAALSTA